MASINVAGEPVEGVVDVEIPDCWFGDNADAALAVVLVKGPDVTLEFEEVAPGRYVVHALPRLVTEALRIAAEAWARLAS